MDVAGLLKRADAGLAMIERSASGVEATGWRPADAAELATRWNGEVAAGAPVAKYVAVGTSARSLRTGFRQRPVRIELPVIARSSGNSLVFDGKLSLSRSAVVTQDGSSQQLRTALNLIEDELLSTRLRSDSAEVWGAFADAQAGSDKIQVTARQLMLVTDRGPIPLRVDGPTRVTRMGVELLLDPPKGIVPEYYVYRTHPSLMAFADNSGVTKEFPMTNLFTLRLSQTEAGLAR